MFSKKILKRWGKYQLKFVDQDPTYQRIPQLLEGSSDPASQSINNVLRGMILKLEKVRKHINHTSWGVREHVIWIATDAGEGYIFMS